MAALPTELVDAIVNFLLHSQEVSFQEPLPHLRSFAEKRALSRCALTCHWWAHRIQPHIFAEIRLRSREDTADLMLLLNASNSSLKAYVKTLIVVVPSQLRSRWEQYLPVIALARRLPNLCRLAYVDVYHRTNPDELDVSHPFLPKALSAFFSPLKTVQYLELRRYRFQHLTDLFRLAGSLERLIELNLSTVLWDHQPPNPPAFRIRCSSLHTIRLHSCSQHWPWLWFFNGRVVPSHNHHQTYPGFHPEDLFAMTSLAQLLFPNANCSHSLSRAIRSTTTTSGKPPVHLVRIGSERNTFL